MDKVKKTNNSKKDKWRANKSGTLAYVKSEELFKRPSVKQKILALNKAKLVSKSKDKSNP
jgi:ribosomal protein S21